MACPPRVGYNDNPHHTPEALVDHRPSGNANHRIPFRQHRRAGFLRTARYTPSTPCLGMAEHNSRRTCGHRHRASGDSEVHTPVHTQKHLHRNACTAGPPDSFVPHTWASTEAEDGCPHRRIPRRTREYLPSDRAVRTIPPYAHRTPSQGRRRSLCHGGARHTLLPLGAGPGGHTHAPEARLPRSQRPGNSGLLDIVHPPSTGCRRRLTARTGHRTNSPVATHRFCRARTRGRRSPGSGAARR
jgi:hypothetical protein